MTGTDEHLPQRTIARRIPPRLLAIGAATAVLLVGVVAVALSGGDDDPGAATSSSVGITTAAGPSTSAGATTSDGATTSSGRTTTSAGATTTGVPALTTVPGQTLPTVPPDTSPDTTLPAPPKTDPPTPSTTGPDARTPTQAYAQEFERYCRNAFSIAPDGKLYDPDFITDVYLVDDCLYWLDPEWGDFYDSAPEAAQAGIDDAISTMEDMSPLSSALCWIDAATEDWGGCWYSPNL